MADHNSANQICTLSAADAVALLHKGDISPLELVEASATRIAETDPARRETVEIRRLDLGVAVAAGHAAGVLVGHQDQEVHGLGRWHGHSFLLPVRESGLRGRPAPTCAPVRTPAGVTGD